MLSLLGAGLPNELLPPGKDNEAGFWEPQKVADLNDEILQALDSEWDDVFAFRSREYLSNFDRFYLGRAVELLGQEFNGSEVIVLKDPRISVLTSFWDRALKEAGYATHYILMVRNPLEVAESLRARNGFPREKSLLLWSTYMIAADRDTRRSDRTFVAYDQLMNDWRAVRLRIEESAGVPFRRNTAAAGVEIDRFLDFGLRHHKAGPDLFSRADVPEEVKTLYRIFSEACEGADVDSAALEAVKVELEKMDLLVGPLLADLRGSARRLSKELAELADAHDSARTRAESLAEQLALRQAEAEAASLSEADHEQRLAAVAGQLAATEAERDRVATEVQEQSRRALIECDSLREQIAALSQELAQQEAVAAEARDSLAIKEAELTISQDLLAKANAEMDRTRDESERELRRAKIELSRVQEESEREKDRVQSVFARDLRIAEEARNKADAAARTNEGKLAQRYREVATLTNLLRQHEQRSEQAQAHVEWLTALNQALAAQPRWWGLMPHSWRRRHEQRRLREAGLFDGDAYLRRYPDVAAAGMDPLDHYLKHGLNEERLRTF